MNQALLTRILRSPRLPSLPAIAMKIIDLVHQQDIDIKEIALAIQHDPALASKLLKTVNSSFYGQAYSISTITHAMVVLGLNSVKTLALGFSLVANLAKKDEGDEGFDHLTYWKRSIYTATAAKNLAEQMGIPQQEEAFLGGLLQDMGMMAMYHTLDHSYSTLLAATAQDHFQLRELEQKKFKMDHTEIGSALAESWQLPPLLIAPIRYHETPDDAPSDVQPLVRCVALGNVIAEVFVNENNGLAMQRYLERSKEWFQIDPEAADPILRGIHAQTKEMSNLFDLPTGDMGHPDEILASANEKLEQIVLHNFQQASELKQTNQKLVMEANTDPLTHVGNRAWFNRYAADQFNTTRNGGGPISLLFLDVDHFKTFNDTYGHPTGDRVLVTLAKQLQSLAPEGALVARYGGEEFAIVVTDMDRKTASQLAEQVRQAIEKMPVQSDEGEALNVTASIGVAAFDGLFFTSVEQLLKAADQGVYAAKAAGRNCVRVFTARTKSKGAA